MSKADSVFWAVACGVLALVRECVWLNRCPVIGSVMKRLRAVLRLFQTPFLLGLYATVIVMGCRPPSQKPMGWAYPKLLPISWGEYIPGPYDPNDPRRKVVCQPNSQYPTRYDYALVIPIYQNGRFEEVTNEFAIAHPFICQRGDNVEEQLARFGERDRVARLVFWVPGYFPASMPGVFRPKKTVSGKDFLVLELQKCVGSEEEELATAMKGLLERNSFDVTKSVARKRPVWSKQADWKKERVELTEEPYDFQKLVSTEVYESRYFENRVPKRFTLWAPPAGRRIMNQFMSSDRKMVGKFISDRGAEKGAAE